MFPIQIIVKNRIFQSPHQKWIKNKLWTDLKVIQTVSKFHINTEFCKNEKAVDEFQKSIMAARRDILDLDLFMPKITWTKISDWDQISSESVKRFIIRMATTVDNVDFDSRHVQSGILELICPAPKVKFVRRTNSGRTVEEKTFISMMQVLPKTMIKLEEVFPRGICGSEEFKIEMAKIKEAKNLKSNIDQSIWKQDIGSLKGKVPKIGKNWDN